VPAVRVFSGRGQGIARDRQTVLTFDAERYHADALHDPVTDNSRLTVRTPGKYLVAGSVSFAANSAGYRQVSIVINGSQVVGRQSSATEKDRETQLSVASV
jgi:hypothetical protein